jgi:ABC-type sulfate transport system substrate-binding protein
MIATVTYTVTGNEPVVAGERVVSCYPASGMRLIDVIINGLSQDFAELTISEEYGTVAKAGLAKGDWMAVTYKTLPRNSITATSTMIDFSETDFESADFV